MTVCGAAAPIRWITSSASDIDRLFAGPGNDDLIGGPGENELFAWSFDPSPVLTQFHFGDGQYGVGSVNEPAVITGSADAPADGMLTTDAVFELTGSAKPDPGGGGGPGRRNGEQHQRCRPGWRNQQRLDVAGLGGEIVAGQNGNVVALATVQTGANQWLQISTTGGAAAVTGAVTAASNASPIVITASTSGLVNGESVTLTGVAGNTAANGTWTIANLTGTSSSLWAPPATAASPAEAPLQVSWRPPWPPSPAWTWPLQGPMPPSMRCTSRKVPNRLAAATAMSPLCWSAPLPLRLAAR